jgi:hypothetical protein
VIPTKDRGVFELPPNLDIHESDNWGSNVLFMEAVAGAKQT